MTPYYTDATVRIHHGDCLDVLRELPDASVDAVVTDPPYGLEFMGKEWDAPWRAEGAHWREASRLPGSHSTNPTPRPQNFGTAGKPFQDWCEAWATECLRVLKPGGHMLAFGGTRTSHRLACAIEDAGFEIRDSIAWLYGSGFPKSLDVSKAIDKAAGAEREVVGVRTYGDGVQVSGRMNFGGVGDKWRWGDQWLPWAELPPAGVAFYDSTSGDRNVTAPATDAARTWQGWGTALKPAHEPIVVARKPLAGTVAANVLAHGTGALNVDGCRVGDGERTNQPASSLGNGVNMSGGQAQPDRIATTIVGRWPANVVLDESQAAALDAQSGTLTSGLMRAGTKPKGERETYGQDAAGGYETAQDTPGDTGGASRFFYVAKADAGERVRIDGTAHPTVKPLALMQWLVRLVTPPGGTVLEPFAGSGTTVEACILEGFACIAIEREADYLPLIRQRIHRRRDPVEAVRGSGEDAGLFDLLGGEGA